MTARSVYSYLAADELPPKRHSRARRLRPARGPRAAIIFFFSVGIIRIKEFHTLKNLWSCTRWCRPAESTLPDRYEQANQCSARCRPGSRARRAACAA